MMSGSSLLFVSESVLVYRAERVNTSMNQASLGPWKFVLDIGH